MHQTIFSKQQKTITHSLFYFQTCENMFMEFTKAEKLMAWNHDCSTELIVYCTCIMPSSLSHINIITHTGI